MALVQGSKHDSTVIRKYKLQIEILVSHGFRMVPLNKLHTNGTRQEEDQVEKYKEDVIHMAIIHISVK